jgi:signal transduction histidine kinase
VISLGFALSNTLQRFGFQIRGLAFVSAFLLIAFVTYLLLRRQQERQSVLLLLLGYAALLLCAAHDIGMVIGYTPPDNWSLNSLGFTAMLLAYTVVGAQYLARTLNRAEDANVELERSIAAKSAQLEASYALLRDSERAAARTQEREHLLREMHDGLGAQLMTALRGVERGAMPREMVVQALQDSLDDLRLLMDSTDLGRTLSGALVAWRGRWSPRLSALGIAMAWTLEDGLDSVTLSPDAVLQIMRIVQEATVNIVKHSQASQMALTTKLDGGALLLEVCDNGIGLPAETTRPGARGLANMQTRCQLLGAQLEIKRLNPQGTVVRLLISA